MFCNSAVVPELSLPCWQRRPKKKLLSAKKGVRKAQTPLCPPFPGSDRTSQLPQWLTAECAQTRKELRRPLAFLTTQL
jgi:hypothetical protein